MTDALPFSHSPAFRRRRFLNWFPMGLSYALLYMGRYNLTVAKNALGDLMTKEQFGLIFGAGTVVYAIAFLLNGPLVDRLGGRRGILAATLGAGTANLLMGLYIWSTIMKPGLIGLPMVGVMSFLYALNMYFQSFGAVSIVKVNAHWFHVRERGGFSGIFGTMISSGIFLAFTVNGWLLDAISDPELTPTWWVFFMPAALLFTFFVIEFFLLRDRPGLAGFEDFDTGDADSGSDMEQQVPVFAILKKIVTNPIIITVAFIEFCTGVLRNGVMHWFPIYVKEVWALPPHHMLYHGSWGNWELVIAMFVVAAILFVLAARVQGRKRAYLVISGALVALAPFVQAGWGGLLFVAGVLGGNIAGWVSDLFFQSRRAPVAGLLYLILVVSSVGMLFTLGGTRPKVGWVHSHKLPFQVGDEIIEVEGRRGFEDWVGVARAIRCIPSRCEGEGVHWDPGKCMCTSKVDAPPAGLKVSTGTIHFQVRRGGQVISLEVEDPRATARAGDVRKLPFGPELTLSPFFLGFIVFIVSLAVIGTHGLLSGTATMDFGGRRGAATAVGMIDGFVYLGTAVQSVSLGYLTSKSWSYWPIFLLPFGIVGFLLLLRIWHAIPKGSKGGH